MLIRGIFLIATIFTFTSLTKAIDINCQYKGYDWNNWGPKQTCFASLMTDLYIFNAKLKHISRYEFQSYRGLRTISLSRNDLSYIPHDTFDDMINLEYFSLSINKLRIIPNLKRLAKLKELYLFENKIEKLSFEDLSGNLNLEVLWIYSNNLNKIDSKIFNFLINLKDARFENNNCISMNHPPTSVEIIKQEINSKC
ncbi:unnamed protein product [Chironomus riparius]|uniref:Uncharacterized protein n=1 Tax=Chironomus riparius TaxID=315576 RepID=A0A9N9S0Y4_9DIPT|nr:unnamed protein product [Chironomus riparius]